MKELQQLQAERLKRLLKEQEITQKELAEKLEVSPTSVNHWVNGKVHMSDYSARLICSNLPGYSPEYLRGYSEYRNPSQEKISQRVEKLQKRDAVEFLANQSEAISIDGWFLEDSTGRCFYELSNGSQSITIDYDELEQFTDEVLEYVTMRLNRIIERGHY